MEWCERCQEFDDKLVKAEHDHKCQRDSLARLLAAQSKVTDIWREKAREYLSLLRQHGIEVKE